MLAASARAQAAGRRVGVPAFEGAGEADVRLKVMQSLQAHGFEVARAHEVQETMARESSAGLDSDDRLETLANALGLSAIVTGEVGPTRAKIVVHDGGEGSILGDASFVGANPAKLAEEVGRTFWKKLGADVERAHRPAGRKRTERSASPESSEAEEAPPPKQAKKRPRFRMEETPPAQPTARSRPPEAPWLDLELGAGGLHRSLTFNQNVVMAGYGLVLPSSLGLGPIGSGKLVAYPWRDGKVGHLGVEAQIEQGFAISTGGYTNDVHEYAVGFRARVPFATTDDLFFSLTFGEDAFTFHGPDRANLQIPDTIYHYVRLGTGMHLTISDEIGVSFGGGYRYVSNHGGPQIDEVFPRLTVAGADADVVARVALTDTFELRAGLEWRRYWYATNSQPGDQVVAKSADDQSFAFTAGIAVLLGVPVSTKADEGGPPPAAAAAPTARPETKPSGDEESGERTESGDPQ